MTDLSPNRLAEARKAKGLTQQQLADKLGVHFVTISKLERGEMQLTADWITKLAEALGVHINDIFSPLVARERVLLDGVVQNGFSVRPVKGIESRYTIETEDIYDEGSSWFAVADEALAPFFHRGDVLRFTSYGPDGFGDFENRLGCLQLVDGRIIIAIVETNHGNRVFDVRTMTGQRLTNIEVEVFSILSDVKIKSLDS